MSSCVIWIPLSGACGKDKSFVFQVLKNGRKERVLRAEMFIMCELLGFTAEEVTVRLGRLNRRMRTVIKGDLDNVNKSTMCIDLERRAV